MNGKCKKCKAGYLFIRPYGNRWLVVCTNCKHLEIRGNLRKKVTSFDHPDRRTINGKLKWFAHRIGHILTREKN